MTSCWSKGRNRHYAYYLCDTPNCSSHRRSIPRADIEDGAEAILRSMRPPRQFFALARAMLTDIWNARQTEAQRARAALADQAVNAASPEDRLEELIEPALTFLPNPWQIYEKGTFALNRTVLKLAFAQPLRYNRNEGYRTAEITYPFKMLADFLQQKCGLVEPRSAIALSTTAQDIPFTT